MADGIDLAVGLDPFPMDAVTQTFAILGKKGSGKTYAAMKFAEQLLDNDAQTVILDPLGNWYGLRLTSSGKGSAYDIPIFGGEHGDLPLKENSGELIADLIVDHGISAILDISGFSKNKRKLFVADFCERLYHRKKRKKSPLHLIIEEAHLFAPQMDKAGTERMRGAIQDIVRLGRNFGMGTTLIDQRPQSVCKEVLNQAECLITMQLVGPHERKAIKDWVYHSGEDGAKMVDILPSLKVGECFIWSPSWLGVMKRTRIKKKRSYDSTGTPTVGDFEVVQAKPLTDSDLSKIKAQMADLVEEQASNDPAALKRKIRELEKSNAGSDQSARVAQLESQLAEALASAVDSQKDRIADAHRESARFVLDLVIQAKSKIDSISGGLLGSIRDRYTEEIGLVFAVKDDPIPATKFTTPKNPLGLRTETRSDPMRPKDADSSKPTCTDQTLGRAEKKMLEAIAWYSGMGINMPTIAQVAAMAGYSPKSGHVSNTLGKLVKMEYIERSNGSVGLLTAAREIVAIPRGVEGNLRDLHYSLLHLDCLSGASRNMLGFIIQSTNGAGQEVSIEDIANGVGLSPKSGHVSNSIGKLVKITVIERSKGNIRTTDTLYPK